MKLGLHLHWPMHSLEGEGNVLGDELLATSLCRAISRQFPDVDARIHAPNRPPAEPLDVVVYLNDEAPKAKLGRVHVAYLQNAYDEPAEDVVRRFSGRGYDGYVFFSHRLLQLHRDAGGDGLFLPFGVDFEEFHPQERDPRYAHEVAYVGNDVKGRERSDLYLLPAADFEFGLYGNWSRPYRRRFWKNWMRAPYQKAFAKLSRGRIPQEDVPVLYSSAAVNLNCTAQACVDWDVITLRTFEVLACRGFLISDKVPAAERLLDGCAVFTDGGDDLRDKLRYYLDRPEERSAIAQRGYDFVVREASSDARARQLVEYLQEVAR